MYEPEHSISCKIACVSGEESDQPHILSRTSVARLKKGWMFG